MRKIIPVLMVTGLAAATPGHADTRDDVVSGIGRCGVIHDNRVWLDCVYGAVQPMRAQLGLQPVPEFQQRLVPPPQMVSAPQMVPEAPQPVRPVTRVAPRKKPGFFDNLLNAPPVATSRMASYRYEKGGFVVTLVNGQQWRQSDAEGGTSKWTKAPSFYAVTITQGAFGNYTLRTEDNPRTYRVELVK